MFCKLSYTILYVYRKFFYYIYIRLFKPTPDFPVFPFFVNNKIVTHCTLHTAHCTLILTLKTPHSNSDSVLLVVLLQSLTLFICLAVTVGRFAVVCLLIFENSVYYFIAVYRNLFKIGQQFTEACTLL